jgi:hypothetical protein
MRFNRHGRAMALLLASLALTVATPVAAADPVPDYDYTTPVFGLAAAPDGSLFVADGGAGIVSLRNSQGTLFASLPGVVDVSPIGTGNVWAITSPGLPGGASLYRVSKGRAKFVADLGAFEAAFNPDGAQIESNPFDVATLTGGSALVADAAANAILVVNARGQVDWVATLPSELVSTAHAKELVGCPDTEGDLAFICDLPDTIPAEAVPTGVAVGPDGAYYVGELKGIPSPIGESRVWRIEPGTRHAQCGTSAACTVVADGFTSIVDLSVGPNGTAYVTELDEAGFFAFELGQGAGGTVNACAFGSWSCSVVAGGLPIPTAAAATKDGSVFAVIFGLVPGQAAVIQL